MKPLFWLLNLLCNFRMLKRVICRVIWSINTWKQKMSVLNPLSEKEQMHLTVSYAIASRMPRCTEPGILNLAFFLLWFTCIGHSSTCNICTESLTWFYPKILKLMFCDCFVIRRYIITYSAYENSNTCHLLTYKCMT